MATCRARCRALLFLVLGLAFAVAPCFARSPRPKDRQGAHDVLQWLPVVLNGTLARSWEDTQWKSHVLVAGGGTGPEDLRATFLEDYGLVRIRAVEAVQGVVLVSCTYSSTVRRGSSTFAIRVACRSDFGSSSRSYTASISTIEESSASGLKLSSHAPSCLLASQPPSTCASRRARRGVMVPTCSSQQWLRPARRRLPESFGSSSQSASRLWEARSTLPLAGTLLLFRCAGRS